MLKIVNYTYLGTNGTLTTPIHLEGIYSVKKVTLIAEEGKVLTKDNIKFVPKVVVSENDVDLWKEVNAPSGQE